MTTLIVIVGIVLLVLIFVVWVIMHDGSAKSIVFEPQRRESYDLMPANMKTMMNETETKVCRKANVIAQMADDMAGADVADTEKLPNNLLKETSFMKAISDKVELVRRISGAKS
jgi:hypothetical protein